MDVLVSFAPEDGATLLGRNGTASLSAIKISSYAPSKLDPKGSVYIEGNSSRGLTVRGGFTIPLGAMDELARKWLDFRKKGVKR